MTEHRLYLYTYCLCLHTLVPAPQHLSTSTSHTLPSQPRSPPADDAGLQCARLPPSRLPLHLHPAILTSISHACTSRMHVHSPPPPPLQVQDVAKAQSVSLPSLLPFRDTDHQASTFRVAALTSLPFLHACARQLVHPHPGTSGSSSCTSATDVGPPGSPCTAARAARSITVPGVSPAALSVLVRLIEGCPPSEISLDVACELVAATQACGANELLSTLPEYLAPMLRAVNDREVRPAAQTPSSTARDVL